jgi:uncharacterized membrane protein
MRHPMIPRASGNATRSVVDGTVVARLVMRGGLAIAAVLLIIGSLLELLTGAPADAVRATQLLSDPRIGDRVLMLGVLVLALTPILQVLVLLVGWIRVHDYRYAAVAAGVIALLAAGIAIGMAG